MDHVRGGRVGAMAHGSIEKNDWFGRFKNRVFGPGASIATSPILSSVPLQGSDY